MKKVAVVIEDGIISAVFSNDENIGVEIVSYDSDMDDKDSLDRQFEEYKNMYEITPCIIHPSTNDDEEDI